MLYMLDRKIRKDIMKEKRVPINYVDNEKLLEALKVYKKEYNRSPETARINNYIGKCIYNIAENLATLPKFHNYSYIDEMKSDGIENVLKYIHNFNPDKYDKPFAYITKIVYYAFLRRIAFEKTEQYVKYKTIANYGIFDFMDNHADTIKNPEVFDNMVQYIEEFESKKRDKKALKKEMKPKKQKPNLFEETDES